MTNTTDQFLIQSTLEGDVKAFAHLVKKYQDYVFTLVYRMLKTREEAEEVAQDVFIKVYKSLKDFKGEAKFTTWLYRIAYRTTLDYIRKNKKREKTNVLLEEITESNLTFSENPLESLLVEERNKYVKDCIGQLSEHDAAVITLFYFEESSIREIAQITGLTEDNVKVRLHRSRKKLYQQLYGHALFNKKI